MLFSWWRSRRRKGIRAEPFPSDWDDLLRRHCRQAAWLGAAEQCTLREWIAVFVAEKRFEGCGGLQITDEVKVAIAAQAGLLTLGWDAGSFYFESLKTLLVYPGDYLGRKATPLDGGGELEWQEPRLGETWAGGSMVLSWPRVVELAYWPVLEMLVWGLTTKYLASGGAPGRRRRIRGPGRTRRPSATAGSAMPARRQARW